MSTHAFNLQCFALLVTLPLSTGILPLAAQETCAAGVRVEGVAVDSSDAIIPSAGVSADSGQTTVADSAAQFYFACLPKTFSIQVQASGSADAMIQQSAGNQRVLRLKVTLPIAAVQTDVQVTANDTVT